MKSKLILYYLAILGLFELLSGTFGVLGIFGDTIRRAGYISVGLTLSTIFVLFSYINRGEEYEYRRISETITVLISIATILAIILSVTGLLGVGFIIPGYIQLVALITIIALVIDVMKD